MRPRLLQTIPIISLEGDEALVAQEVHQACTEHGFMYGEAMHGNQDMQWLPAGDAGPLSNARLHRATPAMPATAHQLHHSTQQEQQQQQRRLGTAITAVVQ
jgi:hypothetical protein